MARTAGTARRLRAGALGVSAGLLVGLAAASAGPGSGAAAAQAPGPEVVDHVIVVGVAGLRWSDVTGDGTPALAELVRSGSAGTLSVRSAQGVTCPLEGWLTLGAGGYATGVAAEPDPSGGCGDRVPPPVSSSGIAVPAMPELVERNQRPRLATHPGTLGRGVPCATAIGPGAALAASDPAGAVDHYLPALPADPAGVLARCPLTVADLGTVAGDGPPRDRDLARLDDQVGRIRAARPPGSVLVVAGVAETDARQPRLHLVVVHGPGFQPGWLRSPSTRRVPYVQLVDLAPTVLERLGQPVPGQLAGRPLAGDATGRPAELVELRDQLVDTDTQAVAQRATVGWFFGGLAGVLFALVVTAVWLLHPARRAARRPRAWPAAAGRWLGVVALAVSAVPAATFVANLVPWWRSAAPAVTAAAVVVAVATTMTGLAIWWARRHPDWPDRVRVRLAVLAALTLLVFLADGVTGGWLQLNSLLGYNPLVAGRFTGLGNIAFAVYAVAAVLLATMLAYGHRRMAALWRVAAVAVPVVVFDGLPRWGADFGGVLALVPTFVLLGLLVAEARVTWLRLAAAGAGGVALVLAVGWWDARRPPADRSHLGRFVISLTDGSALQIIQRKLLTNVELLLLGPHTMLAALGVLVGVALLLIRPPAAVRRVYGAWPATRAGMLCLAMLAGLGFAANDSGVAVPTVMGLVILPLVTALCVWARTGDPWHAPEPVQSISLDRSLRRLPLPRSPALPNTEIVPSARRP